MARIIEFSMKALLSIGLLALASCDPSKGTHGLSPLTAKVKGTFVDVDGQPVGNVRLYGDPLATGGPISMSDASGHFDLSIEWNAEQNGQRFDCYARKRGYVKQHFWAHPQSGEAFDFDELILNRGGVLTGQVLDDSGHPIEGVTLLVANEDRNPFLQGMALFNDPLLYSLAHQNWLESATSDSNGEYEIDGVLPGTCFIHAKHERAFWHMSKIQSLKANSTFHVPTIRLKAVPENQQINGSVVDHSQSPVTGAAISASIATGRTIGGLGPCLFWEETIPIGTLTDSLGNFTLYLPFRPSRPFQLEITPNRNSLDSATIYGVRPGEQDVQVLLGANQKMELLIMDAHGLPVENYGCVLDIFSSAEPELSETPERRKLYPETHEGGRATYYVPAKPFYLNITTDSGHWQEIGMFAPGSLPDVLEITLK